MRYGIRAAARIIFDIQNRKGIVMKKALLKTFSVILALAMVLSLAACNNKNEEEETTTTEPPVISKTAMPQSSAQTVEYFNMVINAVKTGKPAVKPGISKNVGDVECENPRLKAVVPTVKKYMLNTKADEAKAGDDLTDIFPVKGQEWSSRITPADVRYATCNETPKTYEIVLRFKDEKDSLPAQGLIGSVFDVTDKADILKEFEKSAEYMVVDSLDLFYKDCYITCSVDKATDQVLFVKYIVKTRAESVVTGTGALKDMGSVPLKLTFTGEYSYTLDWKTEQE